MRQLIVDLKTEYPDFTDGEIAAICAIQFDGRRPSHHTVKAVLADGPSPSRTGLSHSNQLTSSGKQKKRGEGSFHAGEKEEFSL